MKCLPDQGRNGLSLAEVLISVAILAVAILGLTSTILFHFSAGVHGSSYSEAATYARQLLEFSLTNRLAFASALPLAASSGINDAPGTTQPLNAAPFASISLPTDGRYTRHIETRSSRTPSQLGSLYNWKDDCRQVSVTVQWSENGNTRSLTLACLQRRLR